jgi:hypothetical protein
VLVLRPGRAGESGFEADIEELASKVVALLREGRTATGLRYGDELVIEPGTGPAHERRLLEFLALVGLEREHPAGEVTKSSDGASAEAAA